MKDMIYTIDDTIESRINPISRHFVQGTKYRSFNKETDLKAGTIVFATLFAGSRAGYILEVSEDKETCIIAGKLTFVSDILYTIIKTQNIGENL